MARTPGLGKRHATYVPQWCRGELNTLSKADLMEMVYDLAMRSVGEDAGEIAAYNEVRDTSRVIANCMNRKAPRLADGLDLAKAHNHIETQ